MDLSTTAVQLDAVATSAKVTSMKALTSIAAACAAFLALLAFGPGAEAQAPPRGGGSYHGGPAPAGGGSYRGHPPPRGGYHPRGGTSFYFGYYGPGYWWGPGYWPGYSWGPGYWGPRYGYAYPPYYSYYPPAYVAPDPPVYIEREPAAKPAAPVWWYWCAEARAYYPYVKECPGGWQQVPPQPSPAGKQ